MHNELDELSSEHGQRHAMHAKLAIPAPHPPARASDLGGPSEQVARKLRPLASESSQRYLLPRTMHTLNT